jgi:Domain of unknown function (DUF5753)/Helix-turn-helix domain
LPASPYSSVQQARQILAARLVELQKDAGIRTSRKMAERLGWQESKVSRIVNAVTPPSEEDVTAWCTACDAAGEIPGLIAALRLAAGAWVEWRRMERHGLRAAQESIWPLHERTARFGVYTHNLMPGLIQVRGYTAAVLGATRKRRGLADDVEEAVEVRMQRQQILSAPGKTFVFVLEESVLRHRVADDEVMAEQLGYLLRVAALPNVRVGVIPHGIARERYAPETFYVYGSEQVAVELVGAYLTITQPKEIALYEQAFKELSELAVFGPGIRKPIAQALEALS